MKNTIGVLSVGLLIFAGLACSALSDDTAKANDIVGEANKFVTTANESVVKADKLATEFDTKVAAIKGAADLEKARSLSKDLIKEYDAMADNFKKAGEKFDEASKLKIKDKHKEYLETKAKEMKLRSDYTLELKKVPQKLIDSDSKTDFKDTLTAQLAKVKTMTSDAKDLADKADKIAKDNPDVLSQPK